MYSALLGKSKLTAFPFTTPCSASKLQVRFTAASNSAYVKLRPSASEKRKGLSGVSPTRCSSNSRRFLGEVRPGLVAIAVPAIKADYDILRLRWKLSITAIRVESLDSGVRSSSFSGHPIKFCG